jgi:heparosan-N-sulfate-glucuronate 5-epimerase
VHRWDTGFWSRYDLYPHVMKNVASSFYHALHISQLEAMNTLAPRTELASARERFAAYSQSTTCQARAFVHKALFRLAVPRNRLLARRLPWIRRAPR